MSVTKLVLFVRRHGVGKSIYPYIKAYSNFKITFLNLKVKHDLTYFKK